jgi:hypothetical protein
MEGTNAAGIRESEQAPAPRGRKPYALLVLATLLALAGTVALAAVVLGDESSAGTTTTPAAPLPQQTAFALFAEFHATLILSPATTGANTLDVAFATHDGSPTPEFAEVTVTATLPTAGAEPVVATVEPVEGSPGLYRAELALPEPGDWELTVSVVEAGSEPVAETAVVPIGAR